MGNNSPTEVQSFPVQPGGTLTHIASRLVYTCAAIVTWTKVMGNNSPTEVQSFPVQPGDTDTHSLPPGLYMCSHCVMDYGHGK